jgi:hypothetical protein
VAVSHSINTRVVNDPQFPRVRVFDALKQVVRQVQPELFSIKTTTFTAGTVQVTFPLPADVQRVLRVQYEVTGPTKYWQPVTHWRLDEKSTVSTGKSITIGQPTEAGRTVQVVYAAALPVPANISDDLEDLGIPAEMHDMLLYGACWRLVQFLEPARLQLRSVEQQMRSQGVNPGDATKSAQQFYAMFTQRRTEERRRLLDLFPPTKHYTR